MEGKELSQFTFKKKNKAQTFDFSKSKIVIDEDIISVDLQLFFQRLSLDYDQRTIFSYELSTFPLSTFGGNGLMRDPKPKTFSLISIHVSFLTPWNFFEQDKSVFSKWEKLDNLIFLR